MAVSTKKVIFWVVAPCSPVESYHEICYRRYEPVKFETHMKGFQWYIPK